MIIRRLLTNRIHQSFRILGIETSCDDTAAAVVDSERTILSQACRNQLKYHQPWGGIVPSIAKNYHYENCFPWSCEGSDGFETFAHIEKRKKILIGLRYVSGNGR